MIYFKIEPTGKDYEALLRFALTHCHTFSLTWRFKFPKPAEDIVLAALASFLISEQHTKQWPGTKGPRAIVRHYHFTNQTISFLLRVDGLYQWLMPDYPEDLALYAPNGTNWLASIAHERMSWLTDPQFDENELMRAIPDISIKLMNHKRQQIENAQKSQPTYRKSKKR